MIIQVPRQLRIVVEGNHGKNSKVRVLVTGSFEADKTKETTRVLGYGDEMTIDYETLSDASEEVEAAIKGALALEERK